MDQVFLNNPSFLELDDAYRGLSNFDSVHIKTSTLESTLLDMEKIGFVAIQANSFVQKNLSFTITASKGKHGPCYYSGKSSEYIGSALAALDDDHHIFIRGESKSVCDKTFSILEKQAFHNLILNHDDAPSAEDDDFEQSQENLFNHLEHEKPESDRKMLFYPGPFLMLILDDGTIVRRGRWSSIPLSMAKALIKIDGLKSWEILNGVQPVFFQEAYLNEGSGCLMEVIKPTFVPIKKQGTDYVALNTISKKLKKRLIDLINKDRKYFVLIGNEAEDKLGCCPSEEVSEANFLVRSGILDALSEPVQGDACPVTLYAFKNEFSLDESGFSSKINHAFREKAYTQLSSSSKPGLKSVLKWILLIFVAISMFFAAQKYLQFYQKTEQLSLDEALAVPENLHVQVVLFHNTKRCFQCLSMERFTKEILEHSFAEDLEGKRLLFNTIVIDEPKNMAIVEQYGIFASTIVLLKYENRLMKDARMVLDATSMYQDEEAFKTLLVQEIHDFLSKEHD